MPSNETPADQDLDLSGLGDWLDGEDTPKTPEPQESTAGEDTPKTPEPPETPAPVVAEAVAPKKASKPAARVAPKRNSSDSNMATILAKQEQTMLMIHEMENPPPGGVSIFINGYGFQIQPGQWVQVPQAVVGVLENAVETKSVVADGRIIGSRVVPRYSFSVKPVRG